MRRNFYLEWQLYIYSNISVLGLENVAPVTLLFWLFCKDDFHFYITIYKITKTLLSINIIELQFKHVLGTGVGYIKYAMNRFLSLDYCQNA